MPGEISDAPDLEHHPFFYSAECPICSAQAEQVAWERALLKAHANATGPRTEEGKTASAANLNGHPTPEEAKLNRFNAMKHGLYARTATYFPAKPGKYDRCENCEHLLTLACLVPPRACLKRHELLLRNQIAFETKDPSLLLQIRSDTQAAIQALIDDMILSISQNGGPSIKEIKWYVDKDGQLQLAQWFDEKGEVHQIYEIKANPLLKILMEFISKNSMTLADMGMTPKVQTEDDAMQGFLSQQGEDKEAEEQYRQKSLDGLERLQQLIGNSYTKHEPVTVEGEVVDAERS